jgi:ribosome maturation factor RimP
VEGNKLFLQKDDEIVEIDFNDVKKARTYFEW